MDSAYVKDNFHLPWKALESLADVDLWLGIRRIVLEKSLNINIRKVKSHLLDKFNDKILDGTNTLEDAIGNTVADVVADVGAKNIQLPQEVVDGIDYVRSAHRLVLVRAVQAFKLSLEAAGQAQARPKKMKGRQGASSLRLVGSGPLERSFPLL